MVLILFFSPNLADYTTGNQQSFLPSSFESVKAQSAGTEFFPAQSGAAGSLIVTRTDGGPLSPADQDQAGAMVSALQNDGIAGVLGVQTTPQSLSADGKVPAVQVAFDGQPGDAQVNAAVPAVRDAAAASLQGTPLTSEITGNAAIQVDTTSAFDHADADAIITIATVILILVLLGIIFRSPIIAVIPIIVIGIVLQVVVFLLFRYRESVRAGRSHEESLVFAALLLARLGSLSTLAPSLIVAVHERVLPARRPQPHAGLRRRVRSARAGLADRAGRHVGGRARGRGVCRRPDVDVRGAARNCTPTPVSCSPWPPSSFS